MTAAQRALAAVFLLSFLFAACGGNSESEFESEPALPVPGAGPIGQRVDPDRQGAGLRELGARPGIEHEEREDLQKRQEMFLHKRLPPGMTEYPWDTYWRALGSTQSMTHYSLRLGASVEPGDVLAFSGGSLGSWNLLGPGNIGGRTRDLVIHPTNPNIMLAAGDSGGIFRSTDAGASWTAVAGSLPILYLSDLAFDPNNPNIVYAASGHIVYGHKGSGIYKSSDAGVTWTVMSSTVPSTNANFDIVARIVVSKNNSQRLYAATRTGLLRSTDGGTSWTLVRAVANSCQDLEIRTDVATDHVIAACGNGNDSAILVNTDAAGSGTWQTGYSDTNSMNIQIAVAPSQQGTLYASVVSIATAGTLAILRSTNGGVSWTAVNTTSNLLDYCGAGDAFGGGGAGWIFNSIGVDPSDPNRVWIGGNYVFRSDDGGANWGKVQHSNVFTHPNAYTHVDQWAVVFHPQYNGTTNKIAFVTTDGGIFKTTDARAATDTVGKCRDDDNYVGQLSWTTLNHSFAATQFVFGNVYADGSGYAGGTWDNNTVWGSNSKGLNGWEIHAHNGDGGMVAVDLKNPQIVFTTWVLNGSGKILKSTNEGLNWNDITTGGNTSGLGFSPEIGCSILSPLEADPTSCIGASCVRWWTGGTFVWRSADGVAWTQASTAIAPTGNFMSAMAIAPSNPNRVLAGTDAGQIAMTNVATNATSTTAWTISKPRNGYVSSLAFDPANHNIAYATYSTFNAGSDVGHVFKSTNGGATWAPSDGAGANGIPDIPVHSVVVNPYGSSRIYVGTEIGVFISDDSGATWAAETGLGHVITNRLQFVKPTSELYAFTWGRGLSKVVDPNNNGSYVQATPGAAGVTASSNDGNVPANTVDNNVATRWAANGDGQFITFDLGSSRTIGHATIGVYQGDTRKNKFDLQVSLDNSNWTTVWSGASSGLTTAQETYDFPDVAARYLRYLGHGNVTNTGTVGTWNSLTEVDIFAAPAGGGPPPVPTGLVGTAGNARAMLSWSASSGATGYNVKRATVSGGPYTTIGSPTVTRFVDTGATNGATFFYVVTATNGTGESANTTQVSVASSAATCKTATGGASGVGTWINTSFSSQTGTFTAEYDGTPSAVLDSVIAMSKGTQTAFTGFATLTRFNTSGNIDARNGGAFAANITLPYAATSSYHFRVVVNVPAHSYSIFVTPPSGSEQTVGNNFAFRTEQNAVTSLDSWGVNVNQTGTTLTDNVCNFWVHP
jgi:hypothetical protein